MKIKNRIKPNKGRKLKSIGNLTRTIMDQLPMEVDNINESWEMSLDEVTIFFNCSKEMVRIIFRVLETIGVINKMGKNQFRYAGFGELNVSLGFLKIKGESEGIPDQIKTIREKEIDRLLQESEKKKRRLEAILEEGLTDDEAKMLECDNLEEDSIFSFLVEDDLTKADLHHEVVKGLTITYQKLLMIFLCMDEPKVSSLEFCMKIIHSGQSVADQEKKLRRLYDLINILMNLKIPLFKKVVNKNFNCGKVSFQYIGPRIETDSSLLVSKIEEL